MLHIVELTVRLKALEEDENQVKKNLIQPEAVSNVDNSLPSPHAATTSKVSTSCPSNTSSMNATLTLEQLMNDMKKKTDHKMKKQQIDLENFTRLCMNDLDASQPYTSPFK